MLGASLPQDIDAKLASYVAQEAARKTGAKFLGVIYSSYELPGIDTGEHHPMEVVLEELSSALWDAKQILGIKAAVIVNGHGGNNPVKEKLPAIEKKLGIKLVFNSTLVELEGPHAATGELSMGLAIGVTNTSKLPEHTNFSLYPEVGFVGLEEAKRKYRWAEEQAKEVQKFGIKVSHFVGEKLLQCAVADVINDIKEIS
ncbi:MAG: 2-amino-5-formylamino-6-ribosylaminopyrimidin-4(3H)-one 5'-monophosphate deformylase [Candidatus Hadarchaeales archaeon]